MAQRREELRGPQDPRLEIGRRRNWREKVTPTTDGNIGQKAKTFMLLVDQAIVPVMALEGMRDGQGTPEMRATQVAQIRAIRREAVIAGIGLNTFDLRVKMKTEEIKTQAAKEAEEAARLAKVRAELKQEDAGGFEMKPHGW